MFKPSPTVVEAPKDTSPLTKPKIPDRVGQPSSSDQVAPVAQRVVLYDEDPSDPKGKQFIGSVIWRTEQIVKDSIDTGGQAVVWPSQRSLYRLFDKVSAGKHTTGSASTRRSLAARPEGMFAARTVSAPGEVMEIDSTPLDVMVLLDDGVVGRPPDRRRDRARLDQLAALIRGRFPLKR